MPDSHRLNFQYVNSEKRLREPVIKGDDLPASWPRAIQTAAEQLRRGAKSTAMIASARMTNEELFLARRLVESLGIELFDVLPRPQKGDGFLVSEDGNPNTMGAKLIGATGRLQEIASGFQRNYQLAHRLRRRCRTCGVDEDDLEKLDSLIVMAILPNKTTERRRCSFRYQLGGEEDP
jgi:NADH-quinone oxidoreductase subunit G